MLLATVLVAFTCLLHKFFYSWARWNALAYRTHQYLLILKNFMDAFLDKQLSPLQRVRKVWYTQRWALSLALGTSRGPSIFSVVSSTFCLVLGVGSIMGSIRDGSASLDAHYCWSITVLNTFYTGYASASLHWSTLVKKNPRDGLKTMRIESIENIKVYAVNRSKLPVQLPKLC